MPAFVKFNVSALTGFFSSSTPHVYRLFSGFVFFTIALVRSKLLTFGEQSLIRATPCFSPTNDLLKDKGVATKHPMQVPQERPSPCVDITLLHNYTSHT